MMRGNVSDLIFEVKDGKTRISFEVGEELFLEYYNLIFKDSWDFKKGQGEFDTFMAKLFHSQIKSHKLMMKRHEEMVRHREALLAQARETTLKNKEAFAAWLKKTLESETDLEVIARINFDVSQGNLRHIKQVDKYEQELNGFKRYLKRRPEREARAALEKVRPPDPNGARERMLERERNRWRTL